ncbi:MAG TPA: hypothetical protein VM659_20645 [Dongiaceae bacterium]|nr:hypothetical protein [Dongiaceae bacterium]
MNIATFNTGVVIGSMLGAATIGTWGQAAVLLAIAALLWQIALPSINAVKTAPQKTTMREDGRRP